MEDSDYESSSIVKHSAKSKESSRSCPTCTEVRLYSVKLKHIEIETCRSCSGIFFDHDELEQLLPKEEIEKEPMTAKGWAMEALPYAIIEVISAVLR